MDDMIRQASDQHHPSYDNKAWDKMKQLLDKHLPQRKDRSGFAFFVLLGLLIGGALFVGGYFFFRNKKETTASVEPKKEDGKSTATTATDPGNATQAVQNPAPVVSPNENTNSPANAANGSNSNGKDNTIGNSNAKGNSNASGNSNATGNPNRTVNTNTSSNKSQNSISKTTSQPIKKHPNKFAVGRTAAKTYVSITPGNVVGNENNNTTSAAATNKLQQENGSFNKGVTTVIEENANKNNVAADGKTNAVENKQVEQSTLKKPAGTDLVKEVAKEKIAEPASDKKTASNEKKKSKHSIAGNFGLSFSAGPDISYVELNKPGKVTLSYGVGLSYTFVKKLTLQAGFYVAKKLYSADSADYHAPDAFWNTYPNMDNTVDANCKLYEVPVKLMYNFGQKRHHNWMAGAGISSYFMKNETYNYSYTFAGIVFPKSYSINNENQHNFSVVTLSGGYQYNLSPRVSFSAEPYVKVPLKGVGFGKVHLKGAGVMFNVTVKPFAKRNKKSN